MKPISGKRLCKLFEKHGWQLKRIKSSHHIYAQPGNPTIISVPVHGDRDLKKGTLHKILRDAGLAEEDV